MEQSSGLSGAILFATTIAVSATLTRWVPAQLSRRGKVTLSAPFNPVPGGDFPLLTGKALADVEYYLVKNEEITAAGSREIWEEHPSEVDEKDKGTPDEWLQRHSSLVRLTGRHPFNCEAPLHDLFRKGFITPTSLHYVRSHGSTPRGSWVSHRISIGGLAPKPIMLTMDDLVSMPLVSLPVTLVCCGNRRKEQNMIKQTIGFNWGAAGVSTGVWSGVPLTEILKRAGVHPGTFPPNTYHVRFASEEDKGGDKLPPGIYGTSVTLEKALDPSQDIIVAFMYNGKLLDNDHGFPVRVIIPGYIGGRMIKWLTNIDILSTVSQDYYHFYDNRVLPPFVDAERAKTEDWWHRPEYICNDLNINSAIACPDNDEVLAVSDSALDDDADNKAVYTLQGYAYTGGGRKITRCEISLNSGAEWQLATLRITERANSYGKFWCWIFWSFTVPVTKLARASEIVLRAWDDGTNTQPDKPTWNLMGMLNNPWFRIKIHQIPGIGIRFEHPTMAGNVPGGWMARVKEHPSLTVPGVYSALGENNAPPTFVHPPKNSQIDKNDDDDDETLIIPNAPRFTLAQVKQHATEETGAWIVVKGKVYACAPFLSKHPGGAESILIEAGTDCSESFEAIHSAKAWKMLKPYYIGEVTHINDDSTAAGLASLDVSAHGEQSSSNVALDPKRKIPFRLVEKEQLSPDSFRLRFSLQTPTTVLGLPVGQHMLFSAKTKPDGKLCMRAYTPVSADCDVGYFELVVKAYFPQLPAFPEGGKMSQHLCKMQVGDCIDVRGPLGHVTYHGHGMVSFGKQRRLVRGFAMLAAGTGITPIYQVLSAVVREQKNEAQAAHALQKVVCHVIYANRTEEDILLKRELDAFSAENPSTLRLHYVLSRPKDADAWCKGGGLTGRVSQEMISNLLPKGGFAEAGVMALLCGPDGFQKASCAPALAAHGYAEDDLIYF